MTVCADCGGPVDPDVTHVVHTCSGHYVCDLCGGTGIVPGTWDDPCPNDDCDCPETCAACCGYPGCPTRTPQETTVDDLLDRIDSWSSRHPSGAGCPGRRGGPVTPRWTIGTNGSLMWWAEVDERGPAFDRVDLGALWDAIPDDEIVAAHDALVAAVRDAALLRQARAIAALIEQLPNDYTPEGRLLDLLSPAPDEEGD